MVLKRFEMIPNENPSSKLILSKGLLHMENMNLEKTIDRTEIFLKEQEKIIPKEILFYLQEVIKQDREYIKMVKQWGEQKGIMKVKNI